MKVQEINSTSKYNTQVNNQSFKGASDFVVQALRFLDTNQAWGATAVDFSCMVAPRTITDFTRGPQAGVETLRREASGTVNHTAVGLLYGPLAGLFLSTAINSKYGIKAQKIFADSDSIDILSKFHYDVLKSNSANYVSDYSKKVASSIVTADGKTYLSKDAQDKFSDILSQEIKNHSKFNKGLLKDVVLSDLGVESNLLLKSDAKHVKLSLNSIVDNVVSVSKALFNDKVVESFKHADSFADVNFVKSLKNFGIRRSILGLGIASVIGASIQPLNIYLTKKKTGSDGFVGVEGRKKDNSAKFKVLKGGVAAAFGTMIYGMLTKFNYKNFLPNIQYKGITPTLNQFKLVYGATIMSRFLAARDKDELREAAVKDTLGYFSWLVFGNFVTKGVLKTLDKNLIGKTRDEILYSSLKKAGIPTVENGKVLSFKELLRRLPVSDSATRKSLRFLNIAQLAGYAFSGVVLGIGIPKLNIYMTKKSEQKRAVASTMNSKNYMLKPENLAFLSNQMNFTSKNIIEG